MILDLLSDSYSKSKISSGRSLGPRSYLGQYQPGECEFQNAQASQGVPYRP
jgi:hypothetical protein